MKSIKIKILILFCLSCVGLNSYAKKSSYDENDPELLESSKCVVHFKNTEIKHQIPRDLLHSISLQESGRKHSKLNKTIPWPWTVNVEGKGFYFDSKKEAVMFVKQQRAFGKKSIDIGCMQINLLYHPEAFRSISEAFDPEANVNYGASFLREKYEQHGTWKKAIANYHSANEELGHNYRKSVLRIANNIDKNKFNPVRTYSSARSTKTTTPASYKTSGYVKYERYRSSMMVPVPK